MISFLYETIYSTGIIFFPLYFLGLLGWVFVFDLVYLFVSKGAKKSLTDRINESFEKTYRRQNQNLALGELVESKRKLVDRYFTGYQNNLKTIKIITLAAPLLGLLGTVTGMIKTFDLISLYGNGNPIFIAEGISEALFTTQAGITIAFPLMLAYNFCQIMLRRVKRKIYSL